MRMKRAVPLLILLVATWASAHDPDVVETVTIVDDSVTGAPIKMWGTGDVFIEDFPMSVNNQSVAGIKLSIEENGLWFQNVSSQDITAAVIEILKVDTRGNGSRTLQNIGLFRSGASGHTSVRTTSTGHRHVASLKHEMTVAEYKATPRMAPSIRVHVVSATFADGSGWEPKTSQ